MIGAITMTVGLAAGPAVGVADVQTIDLHNDTAGAGTDCPDDVNDYWHFVITPNNDTYAFASITLNLDGTAVTFGPGEILSNGGQPDNVFVQVPDGSSFTSIVLAGSSADVTPSTGDPKFVLSHLCDGTGTTTTTTTTTTSTTTSTTLPCEWNPQLPPGDDSCVPDLEVSAICFDIDNSGEIERYWHRLINNESVDVDVTWADGSATLLGRGSLLISSVNASITLEVGGLPAATTPAPASEHCQQTVRISKTVNGPERADGEPAPVYTIQVSRLVDATYVPEGGTYELTAGQTIEVPLASTFNAEGVTYRVDEVDAGNAHATSVTPDTFILNGHKNETIDIVIANTFAAIQIEKTVSATTVQPGDELTYTLVAENTGALTLGPVTIYDRLPASVIYDDVHAVGGITSGNGEVGSCTLETVTQPQLVRCDLPGSIGEGEFTPAIELVVTVDPNLQASDTILNQAMAVGNYGDALVDTGDIPEISGAFGESRPFVEQVSTDLSCDPAPDEVCDLSAKVGVSVDVPTTTIVAQDPPTTVDTGSDTPTTIVTELPKTGIGSNVTVALMGAILVLLGGLMMMGTRRPFRLG